MHALFTATGTLPPELFVIIYYVILYYNKNYSSIHKRALVNDLFMSVTTTMNLKSFEEESDIRATTH